MITSKDLRGDIKGFPLWLVRLMNLRTMYDCDSIGNFVTSLQRDRCYCFSWARTPEGHDWWQERLSNVEYALYINRDNPEPIPEHLKAFVDINVEG